MKSIRNTVPFLVIVLAFTGFLLIRNSETSPQTKTAHPVGHPESALLPLPESCSEAHQPHTDAAAAPTASVPPAGQGTLPPEENASLELALDQARRAIRPLTTTQRDLPQNEDVHHFAYNPGQEISARFLDHGVRFESALPHRDWQGTLSLAGGPVAPEVRIDRERLEYHHDGLVEWYVNRQDGIEHGFTLNHRPLNASDATAQLELKLDGLHAMPLDGREADSSDLQFMTPEGEPALAYRSLKVWDAGGVPLAARMDATSAGFRILIDDRNAVYPVTVDPLVVSLEGSVGPQVTGTGGYSDHFAYSVALSEDRALIGTPGEETATGRYAGVGYVFIRNGGAWELEARLESSGVEAGSQLGYAVALDGDTAVLGSPWSRAGDASRAGTVRVFAKVAGQWQEQGALAPPVPSAASYFGYSVALSGDRILVGAPYESASNIGQAGRSYLFHRAAGVWSHEATLTAADPAEGMRFGLSVSLSGDTAVVGSVGSWTTLDPTYTVTTSGAAYVFNRFGTSWSQETKLQPSSVGNGDYFGLAVSVDDERIAVGTPRHYSASAGIGVERVYVFAKSGASWVEEAQLLPWDGVQDSGDFGRTVSLSGDRLLVGAYSARDSETTTTGRAYLYHFDGGSWNQDQKLSASSNIYWTAFGFSVALSGDTALIGASRDSSGGANSAGSAYVYTLSNSSWDEQAVLNLGDGGDSKNFGQAIAVQADRVLVGSASEVTAAGLYAGRAYLFRKIAGSWGLESLLEANDGDDFEHFGLSVALLGNEAMIGGNARDSTGYQNGAVYVFRHDGTSWNQQQKLEAGNGVYYQNFGNRLSVSGDALLIGAPSYHPQFTSVDDWWYFPPFWGGRPGAAYVFRSQGGLWAMEATLTASDGTTHKSLGSSVALSGDTALIGAPGDDSSTDYYAGSAYVFIRNGGAWSQQAKIQNPSGGSYSWFGAAVALDQSIAVIGAPYQTPDSNFRSSGSALIYQRTGTTWNAAATLVPPSPTAWGRFGESVAISGDTVLIGAPNSLSPVFNRRGLVRPYVLEDGQWTAQQEWVSPGPDAGGFGQCVAMDGQAAAIGAAWETGQDAEGGISRWQGRVYIHQITTGRFPDLAVEEAGGAGFTDGVSTLYLGGSLVGQALPAKTLTLRNAGTADLRDLAVSLDGADAADFVLSAPGLPSVLVPGASATISVTFTPSAEESRSAMLHITSNDVDESPFDLALGGSGIPPQPDIHLEHPVGTALTSASSSIGLGETTVAYSSEPKSIIIRNLGTEMLTGISIDVAGTHEAEFTADLTGLPTSLVAGASTSFPVTFVPSALGVRTAQVLVSSDDPDEAVFSVEVSGTGIPPRPRIAVEHPADTRLTSGNSLPGFGSVPIESTSETRTVIVRNTGTADLTNLAASLAGNLPGDFVVDAGFLPVSLAPGGSGSVSVHFSPRGLNARNAELRIASNDPDVAVFSLGLSGTGFPHPSEIVIEHPVGIGLTDGGDTVNFGEEAVGDTADPRIFTIRNTGTAVLKNLSLAIDGSNPGDFVVSSPLPVTTLAPGASTSFSLAFTPTVIDPRGAVLHVLSNDTDEASFEIALAGTGLEYAPDWVVVDFESLQTANNSINEIGDSYSEDGVLITSPQTDGLTFFGTQSSSYPGDTALRHADPQEITCRMVNHALFDLEQLILSELVSGEAATIGLTGVKADDSLVQANLVTDGNGITPQIFAAVGQFPSFTGLKELRILNNAPGHQINTLVLSPPASGPELNVELTGGQPLESGQETAFDFTPVGLTRSLGLVLRNDGEEELTGIALSLAGPQSAEFSLDASQVPVTLPPGASVPFQVTFMPATAGGKMAVISIASTDFDEFPFAIPLVGYSGVDPEPPQIVGFSFTPDSIQLASFERTISLEIGVSDDVSGLRSGQVLVYDPGGNLVPQIGALFGAAQRTEGDAWNGIYQIELRIPEWTTAGTYHMEILLEDFAGSSQAYGRSAQPLPGQDEFSVNGQVSIQSNVWVWDGGQSTAWEDPGNWGWGSSNYTPPQSLDIHIGPINTFVGSLFFEDRVPTSTDVVLSSSFTTGNTIRMYSSNQSVRLSLTENASLTSYRLDLGTLRAGETLSSHAATLDLAGGSSVLGTVYAGFGGRGVINVSGNATISSLLLGNGGAATLNVGPDGNLNTSSIVFGSGQVAVNNLGDWTQSGSWSGTINGFHNGSGASFTIASVVSFGQSIFNQGTLATLSSSGNYMDLNMVGPVTLSGGGEVILNSSVARIYGTGASQFLTNEDNMIRGQGYIYVPVVNQGVIRAEGGLLNLTHNTVFDNSLGRIEIAGNGELNLSGFLTASLGLGELFIEAGGLISNGSALKDANLTGPGPLVVPVGVIEIAGTLSNPIAINYADQPGNHKFLEIEGSTFLTGGGELVMRDGLSHLIAGFWGLPDDLLTNIDNTIRGQGNINVPMVNQGVIRAEGGLLNLTHNTVFDNSLGRIEIAGNGELNLSGFLTASLGLGELFIEAGGLISNGSALKDANLTGPGPLVVPVGVIEIAGTLSNPVAINYADQPGNHKYLEIEGPTFLTGGGELVMRDGLSHLTAGSGNLPDDHLTNVNNTIRGQGNINVPMVNQGVIRAEGGLLSITNNTVFDNSQGRVEIASDGELNLAGFLTATQGLGELSIEAGGLISNGSALKDTNLTGPGPLVVPVGVIEIAGTLSNPVAINYADQPGNHKYLEIEGPTFLTGGGELVMRDGLSHLTTGSGNLPDDHLTNVNNTIRGQGNINVPLVNQGVIRAEGGLLSITNNTVFNNSQGRIEIASDGELNLAGFLTATQGLGELSIEAGGLISNGSALKDTNLTGPGPLVVPVGVIEIAGTLSNPVAINYADQPGNHKYLEIEGPTFLTGGGELVMRDGLSHLTAGSGNLPDDHLTNVNNTIRGQGNINVPMVNQGIIRAEGGTLIVSSSPFTNEFGEIEVASNATLRISTAGFSQGAGGKTVVSGLLDIDQNVTLGAGRIEGGGIIDAQSWTLSLGAAVLAPGSGIGDISSRGTLYLNGTFEIELGGTLRGVDHDTLQHIGNVQLGGNLSVSVSAAFKDQITASDSFTILTSGTTFTDFSSGAQIPGYSGSQGGITGTFANAAPAGRVFTTDGTGSFLVTQTTTIIELSDYRSEDPFAFLTQANAMSDADLDGVPLLFEFLFGGDPAFAGPVYPAVSSGSLNGTELLALDPELSVDHAASYPVFEVLIRRDRQGIGFLPQASGDLSFTENPPFRAVQVGDTSPEGDFDRHRYIILPPSGDSPPTKGFLRLLFDYSSLPPT